MKIDSKFVESWAKKYPTQYDKIYYDPYLDAARRGKKKALKSITEWKNVGSGPRPMRLSAQKQKSFERFLCNLKKYKRSRNGPDLLKKDFAKSAPVFSIFWGHILYGWPIFDIHTNRTYQYFEKGIFLRGKAARIEAGKHWELFDGYTKCFNALLKSLRKSDKTITARMLDRALMIWGREHQNQKPETKLMCGTTSQVTHLAGASSPCKKVVNAPAFRSVQNGSKAVIWLNDRNSGDGMLHESAIRVLAEDKLKARNIGAICRKHGCLDLKTNRRSPRFLIREIGNYAVGRKLVSFLTDPRYYNPPRNKATHCWGGVGYEGGLDFSAARLQTEAQRLKPAVTYLKAFFEVRACAGNRQFKQPWVDNC